MSAPEVVLASVDDLYVWRARRPGLTLFGTFIGRVLVTSRRFLFLSTGTSGIGRAALFSVVGGPLVGLTLGRTRTDELDLGALAQPGSLALPLEHVTACRVARRWDRATFLALETSSEGAPVSFAFMTKLGGSRDALLAAQAALEQARGERLVNPYRS